VDLSGVIFVVLAIVWAVYLIPKALKQHDEGARSRSVDEFSDETRVVARREPVSRRDARLVVNPSGAVPVKVEDSVAVTIEPAGSSGRGEDRRTVRSGAARRRRRIVTALLLVVTATGAAAYLGYLPNWSPALPSGLTVVFLLLCRSQARRQRSRSRRPAAHRPAPTSYVARPVTDAEAATVAVPVVIEKAAAVEPVVAASPSAGDEPQAGPDPEPVPAAEVAAAAEPMVDSGALWDPVPVTLPTYVTKPKARRTVRTIDLGEAGTWTSGRTPEDAEIAARATDPEAADGHSTKAGQRAVGT
jgi:hypothetical protein